MADKPPFYRKILVPLDGSEVAEYALRPVGEIVRGCLVSEVVFLRVVEPIPAFAQEDYGMPEDQATSIMHLLKDSALKYLNDVVSRVRYAVKTEVMVGNPSETIVDYAAKVGVDLIVMSTHGRSPVSRWVWGSVTEKVLRGSSVPILLVRAPGCLPRRIVYRPPPANDYPLQ